MKTEINLQSAIGKTISCVEFSNLCGQCVIVFTDGTFSTLGVKGGYDPGNEEVTEDTLETFRFGDGQLERAGIVSGCEITAMRIAITAKANADRKAKDDAKDLREFERLKKKFHE